MQVSEPDWALCSWNWRTGRSLRRSGCRRSAARLDSKDCHSANFSGQHWGKGPYIISGSVIGFHCQYTYTIPCLGMLSAGRNPSALCSQRKMQPCMRTRGCVPPVTALPLPECGQICHSRPTAASQTFEHRVAPALHICAGNSSRTGSLGRPVLAAVAAAQRRDAEAMSQPADSTARQRVGTMEKTTELSDLIVCGHVMSECKPRARQNLCVENQPSAQI